jgi:hypothetical protein
MPARKPNTIAWHLVAAQLMIENTLAQPEILEAIGAHGYGVIELADGQQLHRSAVAAVAAQAAAAGAACRTTEQTDAAEQQARYAYQGLVQTVRAIYRANASQRTTLEVVGPMPDDTAKFIAIATTLFNNALSVEEIAVVLARYGYDAATLQRERALITTYQQAVQAQALAKGAAKRATSAQRQALSDLQRWVTQYTRIAKIALRRQPALLKSLGISTQNGRPARHAPPEAGPPQLAPPSE